MPFTFLNIGITSPTSFLSKFLVFSIFICNEVIFFLLSLKVLHLVMYFLPSFIPAVVYASLAEVLLVTSRLERFFRRSCSSYSRLDISV